jgi:hypothetical protein
MKRPFLIFVCALTTCALLHGAASDGEVEARRTALEVAGAFTNEGFKLRDGNWAGSFEPGKPKIVQVNLYAGNQYWFTLGSTAPAKKISLTIFDETGKAVKIEPDLLYQEPSKFAAGFSPENSGTYFIKAEVVEGAAADFCLVYSYK